MIPNNNYYHFKFVIIIDILELHWIPQRFSMIIWFRFIQNSDTLLCPAIVGNPHSFYIQIILPRLFYSIDTCNKFFSAVADKWMMLRGVPHWHKKWTSLSNIDDHIRSVYGQNLRDFENIRKSVDPQELFLNERMKQLFHGVSAKVE